MPSRVKRLPDAYEFEGRVLDGPLAGDWIKEDSPWFDVMVYPVAELASYGPNHIGLPPRIETKIFFYKWLHSYRAWAWVQDSRIK